MKKVYFIVILFSCSSANQLNITKRVHRLIGLLSHFKPSQKTLDLDYDLSPWHVTLQIFISPNFWDFATFYYPLY